MKIKGTEGYQKAMGTYKSIRKEMSPPTKIMDPRRQRVARVRNWRDHMEDDES